MTCARGPSPNPAPLPGGQPTPPQALSALTLTELVRAIRDGSLSPADLVTEALTSLHRWQPVTTAASQIWPEEALQAARALPADPHLPLAGIPVLVKENMDVAGHKSTACCDAFHDRRASEDAQLVASLRAAGAIVIGKANMHELAASATGHISACGPMHNPWDPARLAGGSSGGSAAAVAARSVPLALGTDTAGSIRIPSSFCGVAGLKPTQGRLSMRGIMPLAPSLGCAGPVAYCAEDLSVAFAALAGKPGSVARMEEPTAGLTVARARASYFAERIHPDARGALNSAAEVLAAAGLLITDASLPGMENALGTWGDIAWPELADSYPDLDLSRVGSQIAAHYGYGKNLPEQRKARARAQAGEIRRSFLAALRHTDALLLPCTPYSAPRLSDAEIDVGGGQAMNVFHGGPTWFTCPVNIAGLPALALPAGFDAKGLPLGVQLVGRPGEEWTLLRIARAFEAGTRGQPLQDDQRRTGGCMETIVVAMGGNALARHDEHGTYAEQKANAGQLASVVHSLLRDGYRVLVTHGNGPQVGNLAIQQEEGSQLVPPQPLSVLSAMTQGQIGHLLVTAITSAGTGASAVSVITHTVVDAGDPAFQHPTKPVGSFLSERQARALGTEHAWTVARDSARGWRRVVPSPEPREIIEAAAIRLLVEAGFVVVACGGGGIPVTRAGHGLQGAEAVIDKDLSAALLASAVGASALMMLTDVDRVMLDFGSATQRAVDVLTVDEAEQHLADGQFPPGSMGPKITAAVRFLRGGGRVATVTSPEQAAGTLGGTRIVLRPGDGTEEAA